jgi:protein transport protein SEC23
MSYTFDTPPQPVLLDSVSIKHDVILLLDTFFHILIFHGELVAQWRKQGYQDQEGYDNFKELLEVPVADAQVCILFFHVSVPASYTSAGSSRGPLPHPAVYCLRSGRQSSAVPASKLNPSKTHMTNNMYGSLQAAPGRLSSRMTSACKCSWSI